LFKQEIVAKSAIFVKKKKYAYWAVNEEGAPVDKISITGLEMVRSDSAEAVRIMLKDMMDMVLKGAGDKEIIKKIDEYTGQLKSVYPEEIAANIGINNLRKYLMKDGWRKGTPWHVKGVYNYRMLLKDLKVDHLYEDIHEGTKGKVVYVKPNPYGIETITFLRWPKEFDNVVQIDYEKMVEKFFLKKVRQVLLEPMDKVELIDGVAKERLNIFFEGVGE
jgi:DNA polymerase I